MSAEIVLSGKTLATRDFCNVLIDEVKNGHARLHHRQPAADQVAEPRVQLEVRRI